MSANKLNTSTNGIEIDIDMVGIDTTEAGVGSDSDSEAIAEDIDQNCLDHYEFSINEQIGCRIYSGVLIGKKQAILDNIKYYSSIDHKDRLSPIKFNTSNTKGKILNLDFKDESIIKTLNLSREHKITKVGCNEEEIYIFPNEYVGYNIAHIIDIVKNSFNKKYRTRIRCNCQNLLDHRDYICKEYDVIKNNIQVIKNANLINRIDKYLKTKKHRAKDLLEILMKICKKMMVYNFHHELLNVINIKGLNELFTVIGQNPQFERDTTVQIAKDLFERVGRLVGFFKEYVAKCKCVRQPYNWNKPQLKIVSADFQEIDKLKPKKHIGRKKYSKSNVHGCGKYFNSQITFDIYDDTSRKLYKIKIFRNGNFQLSGVKDPVMHDIIKPLTTLCTYLSRELHQNIIVSYIISISRVYVCNILEYIDKNTTLWGNQVTTHILLDKLARCCRREKQHTFMTASDINIIRTIICSNFNKKITDRIMEYLAYTPQCISEIIYDSEINSGHMIIKFHRPIPNKPDKKITIKIQYKGVISLNGCNSELEAIELYHWLEYIFNKYWEQVMFIPANIKNMEYISDDEYHSLYDDDVEVINRIDAKKKAILQTAA